MDEATATSDSTASIQVIIHSVQDEPPIIHMFADGLSTAVQLTIFSKHFWGFEIEMPETGANSISILYSPTCGPTETKNISIHQDQPFAFVDLDEKSGLIPFPIFQSFFSFAISRGLLSISFNHDIQSEFERFFLSFSDEYFIWALTFLSAQPWYQIFQPDEAMASILLTHLKPFILRNFFHPIEEEQPQIDFHCFEPLAFLPSRSNMKASFASLSGSVDVLLSFIRAQLGDDMVFLLSSIICEEFPSNIPPMTPDALPIYHSEAIKLLMTLHSEFSPTRPEEKTIFYEKLSLSFFSIMINSSKFALAEKASIDPYVLIDILSSRLLSSNEVSEEYLQSFYDQLPESAKQSQLFASSDVFIPLEWMNTFIKVFKISAETTKIVCNSIKKSMPEVIAKQFCKVTRNGALIMDRSEEVEGIVLQPKSIVQPDVTLGAHSMILAGTVATKGSIVPPNCYTAAESFTIPAKGSNKAESSKISESAKVEPGASIGERVVVEDSALIESGAVLEDDCRIGRGAKVSAGAIVCKGEYVEDGFIVPIGFTFRRTTIERSKKIESAIKIVGKRFVKNNFGNLNLKTVFAVKAFDKEAVLSDYIRAMSELPRECGRELGANANDLNSEKIASDISGAFGDESLLVFSNYWKCGGKELTSVFKSDSYKFFDHLAKSSEKKDFIADLIGDMSIFEENGVDGAVIASFRAAYEQK